MTAPLMLDTDVIIDYLRGRSEAVTWIGSLTEPAWLSVITVSELYAGVREGRERALLDDFIETFGTVEINAAIAKRAGLFRRDYGKSHNTGLGDAVIAASAESIRAILVTFNLKHFPMLSTAKRPYAKS